MTAMTRDQSSPPSVGAPPAFQDYRAPRLHGECLIEPALGAAEQLIAQNVGRASNYGAEIASLRAPARQQLLRDARRYTSAYRDVDFTPATGQPIVMAGHQPTLFHPGVWFKNFALDRIGSITNSIAINLVVDSDVAGPSSVRVPHRLSDGEQMDAEQIDGELGFRAVPYDSRGAGVPYEQALIHDRELFDSFDRSVRNQIAGLIDNPMVGPLWQHAREAIQRCGYAGCALAQARHRLEADLGLQTLEIPQSVVCRGEAFASFAMMILRDLPRFHECYNGSAELFRRAHGIRSTAHPVPNLARDGDWYEAPFWVYGNQSPQRQSVWVRISDAGSVMEISDRGQRHRKLSAVDSPSAGDAFGALASPEFKLRSRALVTTMYARLVLSDLFLHGIGGGKYDQLGDLISRSFFAVDPPDFMVMSATVLLPGHETMPMEQIKQQQADLQRNFRDLQYQPERFTDSGLLSQRLLSQKQRLLDSIPPHGQRSDWHQEITQLNAQLSAELSPIQQQLDADRSRLDRRLRDAAIWNSREHSFCVYPLDYLQNAYRQMLSD
ncbi:hypothetical protein NHH03_10830 [Stieleria sp. TO1_6]|uniref:hypothetical protein n=1 Tax=Stieleria tagensis TaxID=2956795 RepID=UPI00209B49B8|nr:hypothetical protein [Stieleria tagensis]MCO8122234.1 hypothetical protein [Stieleria tagensis]